MTLSWIYYRVLALSAFVLLILFPPFLLPIQYYIWMAYLGMYAGFVLLFVGIILLIAVVIEGFNKYGFIKGLKETSIAVYLGIAVVGLGLGLHKYRDYLSNQVSVTIYNKSGETVRYIEIAGRNAVSKVDSLAVDSSVELLFRGMKIDYDRSNAARENVVYLQYYINKKWFHDSIISSYSVMGRSLNMDIYSADSVHIWRR